jgi:hypothetical protein
VAWAVVGAGAVTAGVIGLGARLRAVTADLARERDHHLVAYAGSFSCTPCHAEHAASWHRTFHRTMTEDVGRDRPDPVAGDFSGVTYRYDGVTASMHRDAAGRYLMSFQGPSDRAPVDAVVVRTVGSRRYQQYLAEANGALWRLPMAYHVEERRWFHMNGAFLTPDPEPVKSGLPGNNVGGSDGEPEAAGRRPRFGGGAFDRHVTRWNDNCVFCHNVAPNPGRDPVTGALATRVAELGVACEACHGPGSEHVRANADPVRRYVLHASGAADPTIVNPARLSPARSADLCGRCHGQRIADDVAPFLSHGDPFVPGDDLGLYSSPLWRDTPSGDDRTAFATRFWDDGTPRLTAYEYQGLLESRCSQRGTLTCTSCHGMHEGHPRGQLRPSATGDRACTGCHVALGDAGARAAHTRHDPGGPGARCTACHMPRIVYGVLDVHVSHRIEIPDPARAVALGRPDACTLCHVDRDRAWASRERARLWPGRESATPPAGPPAPPARVEPDHLAPAEALFAGDPVARAVAAVALGAGTVAPASGTRAPCRGGGASHPNETPVTARAALLLEAISGERYPAVRHLAARSLAHLLEAGDPRAAALARGIDATGDEPTRGRTLTALRAALSCDPRSGAGAAWPDRERLQRLRSEARRADIDIGE